MDEIISKEELKSTYTYIDNVTVCGHTQADCDHNLRWFIAVVKKYKLTLNREKCSYNLKSIKLLGYIVKNGTMMPDLERLKPLMELPVPGNMPALRWALGMFAHSSQWVASLKKNTPIDASIFFSFVQFRHQSFLKYEKGYR